jgi:hypothetical protein
MSWDYDTLKREWPWGGTISVQPGEVVAALERCEALLGRAWIERRRSAGAPITVVVAMGQKLVSLEGLGSATLLIEKIAADDPSAATELHAIHILRAGGATDVELFPEIAESRRVCDLRARLGQGAWVYVEVTRPDVSETFTRASASIERILASIAIPLSAEVDLNRELTDAETATVIAEIRRLCADGSSGGSELPDGMGSVACKDAAPQGPIEPRNYGEDRRPRLGQAWVWWEQGVVTRRILIRIPHSDERAVHLLHREAAQLPKAAQG